MNKIYRVTIDENGETDCVDFTKLDDAMARFRKVARRRSVFSVAVDVYDATTREFVKCIAYCED